VGAEVIVAAVVLALVAAEAKGLLRAGVHAAVRYAAAQLPVGYRDRYLEEWTGEAAALADRPLTELIWALGVLGRIRAVSRELAPAPHADPNTRALSPAVAPERLAFEFPGGPYAVTASRLALAELIGRLDENVLFDIRLLVAELATNAVRHGHAQAEGSIVLTISIDADLVRVELADDGPGFPPSFPGAPREAEAEAGAGWGLFLVDQLAYAWGADDGPGGCVWFELERDRSSDSTPGS
jgi:anti-sigma regulatory factor (Ser/Thr protein kinase)